ncbi:BMP family protein [Limnoraphis robusta Tam1]|uniref:BMP family protein n=1 Tax=Limnoraphis robusta CCNP1315 TaxID=3110306 RepID=A0ABU5TWM5_9CYAN|nr:BMP family protein [Limnoraphis robusta]MEA5501271.1 BMP family protein [Limnoraphis robusta BA-68 BA1]MEA5518943.1 BMP family protein [Limnoraphis robusta CCNP1315]MEA5538363.1 BMP family protein [Limnoraphis robusta Tam1]MEA5548419.1 BMP family protein [Limnoraphis robusta CCNP1324]
MLKPFKILRYFILAVVTFTLVSCLNTGIDSGSPSEVNHSSAFKVAILLSGSKADGNWNQGCYEGLLKIEEKYNAKVAYSEYVNGNEGEEFLRQYAEQDYDFIIAAGGGYLSAIETVAVEFPRAKFAVIATYPGNNKNLGAISFRAGEVGYLSGVIAAMKTQTNKIAYVAGADYQMPVEAATLYQRGAQAINPNIEVYIEYLQTWTDGEKAINVTQNLVKKGVDVFTINADEAGVAAIEVLKQNPEVYMIGWIKDMYELAPDRMITSVLHDFPALLLKASGLVQEGRWQGTLYKFGLKEGIYEFAPFRDLLTEQQKQTFSQIREQVVNGEIDITP